MVLVPLLGSRGSKKITVLLQSQPSQTLPPHRLIIKKREEGGVLPGSLDIILSSEATDVVRDVPKPKRAWTARAIKEENRKEKGSSPKGWGESCNEYQQKYLVKKNE